MNAELKSKKTLMALEALLNMAWNPSFDKSKLSKNDICWLVNNELIKTTISGSYELTARGYVYVEAIRNLPLPIQTWVMP